jgi:two-component system sensor histidine kinase ChvG
MFLRGILPKILALMVLFNIALWAFIFFTDDASIVEIRNKQNQLYERSDLYVKLVEPVFAIEGLSSFSRKLAVEAIFRDGRLVGIDDLVVTEVSTEIGKFSPVIYFDGHNSRVAAPIEITLLKDTEEKFVPQTNLFDPFEKLFVFYKSFFDLEIVTEPYVAKLARSTRQFQLLNPNSDFYELSYFVPVKVDGATVAILSLSDQYYLRESYLGKNQSRLEVLAGLSLITLIFGTLLAVSIALPIRRLSRSLNRKLKADTLVDQLGTFQIDRFEKRKDEVGLLYRNLSSLHQQIITLFNDKERFAADVSHELKNPIASIIANTENAMANTQNTSDNIEAFAAIQSQAVRMNKLISEISEAAIVDHDLVSAQREEFDLSETLKDLVEFFQDQSEASEVAITSIIQKKIKFVGLPDRIARVIINLLENAISFAGENGEVRVILKKSWRRGIVISIDDSGVGVPEASQEDIFERFYSSREGSTERENSSGLGLYICKQVVEAHQGTIEVSDSKVLTGASFVVKF